MPTIKELREKVANIVTESRSKLDEITDSTAPDRAQEIEREVDAMLEDVRKIERDIDRRESLEAVERRQQEADERAEREARESRRPRGDGSSPGVDDGARVTYEDAFRAWFAAGGDKSELSPEQRAALNAGYRQVPAEQRAQTTTAAAGGYTIPETMRPELVRSMLAFGPMYDPGITFELVTAGGNPMPFPTVNDTANSAAASTEGATLTDDGGVDVVFGEKQLDAYSFDTEWIRVSLELAQDSAFNMGEVLGSLLGERLGRIANTRLTTGTGSSQPHGIVTAATAGKTTASGTAITYDEILDLEHSVDPAYRTAPSCRYMMNDSTLLYIRKLKDGDGNYLWQMGNVQQGIPNTINGRPYSINQAMASIGVNNRTMVFGDFRKYYVRKIAGMPLIGAIQDKDFWPGFGIAGYIRFDGELSDTAAVKAMVQAAT